MKTIAKRSEVPIADRREAVIARRVGVSEILNLSSHGTGRKMSRGDRKALAAEFDCSAVRKQILLPTGLEDASLRTDRPLAYRDLDECLAFINDSVVPVTRYSVVGYMGISSGLLG